MTMHFRNLVMAGALVIATGAAWSHDDSHGSKSHAFGQAGDPRKASRTLQIRMDDAMRFHPGDIVVKRGATVRFLVRNDGKLMHEMVIGTMSELKKHAEAMRSAPGMVHDEPYIAHLGPGKQSEIVWHFTKPGEFFYACLVPGHMEAGMIAKITVQ